jgi:hypothetical protein
VATKKAFAFYKRIFLYYDQSRAEDLGQLVHWRLNGGRLSMA